MEDLWGLGLRAFVLIAALSLDAWAASFAYGAGGIRIPPASLLVISGVCSALLGASMLAGELVSPLLPGIIDVDIHSIPARPALGEPAHLHYDIRYLLVAPHMHFALSAESDALAWRTAEELESDRSLFDDSVLRLIRLWKMWLAGAKISA